VAFIAGTARETGQARAKSMDHARSLADDIDKSKKTLEAMSAAIEQGRNSLVKDRKFPATLAQQLGVLYPDFDGGKLAGVRFHGFSQESTAALIDYVTRVQSLNERKQAVIAQLQRLQKPMTEQLERGAKKFITHAVFVGRKDDPNNPSAVLGALSNPIEVGQGATVLPSEFSAFGPRREPLTAPKYAGGPLDKLSAIYVSPESIEAACPNENIALAKQLGTQLARIQSDINGESASAARGKVADSPFGAADAAGEARVGLAERATKLSALLRSLADSN